jgi:hypothetical protein
VDFESYDVGALLRGQTTEEGITFVGDDDLTVVSPGEEARPHSGSRALEISPGWVEFGSAGVPMRIRFANLQDFVGVYVGLASAEGHSFDARLTAFGLDEAGHRVIVGSDVESLGPDATPINVCLAVSAPGRIYEVTIAYGLADVGQPELIDDLVLRGPTTPVPVPEDDLAPVVEISSPANGSTVSDRDVRLQGIVTEDRELAKVEVRIYMPDFKELPFSHGSAESKYAFVMDPIRRGYLSSCRENTIEVRATDSAGNVGSASSTFTYTPHYGDLSIDSVEPVQVVYGAPLVRGKGTAFRVKFSSTFACAEEVYFRLDLPDTQWSTSPPVSESAMIPDASLGIDWGYPEIWGPVTARGGIGGQMVMLPFIPAGQESAAWERDGNPAGVFESRIDAGGVYRPSVRYVPRPAADTATFAVEIDPEGQLPETDEGDNRWASGSLEVVTTRPYLFAGFQTTGDEGGSMCTPTLAQVQSAFARYLDYILAVYPLADAKIGGVVVPFPLTYDIRVEGRDPFLVRVAEMAKRFGYDFGVALNCPDGGGVGVDAVVVGAVNKVDEILAHEFQHVVVPISDVYSLDCYCNWGESYCELPSHDRFYCCYHQIVGGSQNWDAWRATEEANGVDPGEGCLIDCGQDETAGCDGACCNSTCQSACAARGGTWYWCPDSRPGNEGRLKASDGFWVNRWLKEEGKMYFMDGPSGNNWIVRDSMRASGLPACWDAGGTDKDGYVDLLDSPRFLSAEDPAALLVSGSITRDGKANLRPFQVLPEARLDLAPGSTGDYALVLSDQAGNVLTQSAFSLVFQKQDGSGPLNEAYFVYRIEWKDGTARIELKDSDGRVLAARDVSPHAPEVQVVAPNGGTAFAGANLPVRWSAGDADGDALFYSVAVSADGGKTWLPVAVNLTETHFDLNAGGFAAGAGYLIKVVATDGVNAAEDVTDASFVVRREQAVRMAAWIAIPILLVIGAGLIVFAIFGRRWRAVPHGK